MKTTLNATKIALAKTVYQQLRKQGFARLDSFYEACSIADLDFPEEQKFRKLIKLDSHLYG